MKNLTYLIMFLFILTGCGDKTAKTYQIVDIKIKMINIQNKKETSYNTYLLDIVTKPKEYFKYSNIPIVALGSPQPYCYGCGDSIRSIIIKDVHYKNITDSFTNFRDSLIDNYYLDFNDKQIALLNQETNIEEFILSINNNLFNFLKYPQRTDDKDGYSHIYRNFYAPRYKQPDAIKICLKDKEIIGTIYRYLETCSLKVLKDSESIVGNKLYGTEE